MHCQIRDYENSTKFEPINTVYFYISLKSSGLLNLESDSKSYHPISDFLAITVRHLKSDFGDINLNCPMTETYRQSSLKCHSLWVTLFSQIKHYELDRRIITATTL